MNPMIENSIKQIDETCVKLASILATPVILAKIEGKKYSLPPTNIYTELSKNIQSLVIQMIDMSFIKVKCDICRNDIILPEKRKDVGARLCPDCMGIK